MKRTSATGDFPITRATIDELDGWLRRLAAPLLPAQLVRGGWEFRERNAYSLMVAKAVRMVSAIRSAMLLVDNGFVTESACLLRIVSDLALEIVAVAEGELRDERTRAQQDFVAEFFARKSASGDASLQEAKRRYVSREELMKAHVRLAKGAGMDGEELRSLMRTIVGIYDGYVHGAYSTAMELYHGERHDFMLRGHEGHEQRVVYRIAIAGKVA